MVPVGAVASQGDEDQGLTWPDVLSPLMAGASLERRAAAWAMDQIMTGSASDAQIAAFVIALRAKGESVEELTGISTMMLDHAVRFEAPTPALDIVGTGGDRQHTVNISTMASIVCAGAGATIVKHGNRAASSSSGSTDVLEALGVTLDLSAPRVAQLARTVGITFCPAQIFHPSMKFAANTRRDLAIPTVFNVLGPLTNPGQPSHSAVGVADSRLAPLVAGVFAARHRRAAVFRGDDGLDEITTSTTSTLWWVRDGAVQRFVVDPANLGLSYSPLSALRGQGPSYNAAVVRDILAGSTGPIRDAVLLNAGIALALIADPDVASQAAMDEAYRAGISRAAASIDSGSADAKLREWIAASAER